MKIAFLTTRMGKASARLRFLQYVPGLEKAGMEVEIFIIPHGVAGRLRFLRGLKAFDLVFLQKKLFSAIEWHFLRKNSKRLVYDYDDAVMFGDSIAVSESASASKARIKRFERTVRGSDLVIAGNSYLKEIAAEYGADALVIPTPVDTARYGETPPERPEVVTLGWIGSAATLPYLEGIKDVLIMVSERHPAVRLKIVADKFFEPPGMPVIKKKWSYEDEISDLRSFTVGLMPLTLNAWTKGKCGFKLLQYMAAGVPSVSSPVGVANEIIEDGVNGFLARDSGEWVECIERLIVDPALCNRIAFNAKKTVTERYSLEVNAPRFIKAISWADGAESFRQS